MSKYAIKKVDSKHDMRDFVRLPRKIYAGNPYYVPDLESDVRDTFDPRKNPGLEFSSIVAYLVYDSDREPVGRIAGIINRKANETWHVKTVRFTFLEMIDDIEVTRLLLGAVEQWGKEQGMTQIQGPLGISDFDKEGMLVDDFDQLGSAIATYNLPYYPKHMEQLGFGKVADWVSVRINVPAEVPKRFAHAAQMVQRIYGVTVRKLTGDEITRGGYGHKIFRLLNEAYKPLFGFSQFSDVQIDYLVKKFMPLVDYKRMMPVVLDREGNIVGVAITMGSLSRAMQKANGRLLPFGWFHLLRALKTHREDKAELLLVAVRPDFQGLGVNALFFTDLIPVYNQLGYKVAETGPQLENNVKELGQWKLFDPQYVCRRRCFGKDI